MIGSQHHGRSKHEWLKLLSGPGLALLVLLLGPGGDDPLVARTAAIAIWMAAWWVTEAVPIPVTALLPLVLLPGAGVLPIKEVAPNYGRSVIFLFLGGFILALGLQSSGVHRRLALWIVHLVGERPRRLVLGFMMASAFLSMWISNTATVMVLMPIGLSVLATVAKDTEDGRQLGVALMLGMAYAADIGGMSTLVGTPPNISYSRLLTVLFPEAPSPAFTEWMMMGLPISIVFLFTGWWFLTRVSFRLSDEPLVGGKEAIATLRSELGPLRRDEWVTASIFCLTAFLWMTRGSESFLGWSQLPIFKTGYVDDAFVAIAMAILLFIIPSHDRLDEHLMEWSMMKALPWGMLLLFGGGFALASGFKTSGLSHWVGEHFSSLSDAPPLMVVAVVCVLLTMLTELTSNTATTEMVLPILGAAGVALKTDPRLLMIPATLSASCAFMMPVASPTQAIVFGSGWVPIKDMVRAGIWFNIIGVVLVVLATAVLLGPVMGVHSGVMPDWAHNSP
jgi:solute carrier family 13 (sodium-dependent dicarboxylate transporter), member 2/3/5